jgi:hypothetical protein
MLTLTTATHERVCWMCAALTRTRTPQERDCTLCRECLREPELARKVRVARHKRHFIFTVESTGILPPAELFRQSVQILHTKAKNMLEQLEQLEGKLAVEAMEAEAEDDEDEDQ